MSCNHSMDKDVVHLGIFDEVHEVYMCECGALLDNGNPDSYIGEDEQRAMTPAELTQLVNELVAERVRVIERKVLKAFEEANCQ